jgi:glucan phosphoethanolaminetransferase (alkaline phosphatase superfamily)
MYSSAMPLDGFRILDWASANFGALPPMIMGALGLAVLIAGVIVGAIGLKLAPISWGLVLAGGSMMVLTYFIVGAAISSTSSNIQGGEQVASMAPRVVPWAAALVPIGLAMFGIRAALRSWSSEEGKGKAVGAIFALVSLAGFFLGVQVIRGSATMPSAPSVSQEQRAPASNEPEAPVRRRGVTATRR